MDTYIIGSHPGGEVCFTFHNANLGGVGGSMRSVAATVQWGGVSAASNGPVEGALRDPVRVWVGGQLGRAALHAPDRARQRKEGVELV